MSRKTTANADLMTTSFRVDRELWEQFKASAERVDRTAGAQLRFLMREHVAVDRAREAA